MRWETTKALNDLQGRSPFEGVIVTRFDMLLGPTPAVVYPEGFIVGDVLSRIAMDTMLLLSMGKKGNLCSIMYFPELNKVGMVGIDESGNEGATAVIVMFSGQAEAIIWETYPLIKSLILRGFPSLRSHPSDVAIRLYEGVQRICDRTLSQQVIAELKGKLRGAVDDTLLAINSLIKSGSLIKLGLARSGIKTRLIHLSTVLKKSKLLLEYPQSDYASDN
jgi:hypothetical protein